MRHCYLAQQIGCSIFSRISSAGRRSINGGPGAGRRRCRSGIATWAAAPRRFEGRRVVSALTRSHARNPLMLCLNLQRCHMDPASALYVPRAAHVSINAQSCMSWARRTGIPVAHVHGAMEGLHSKPISGCRPLSREPLFHKNGQSFFESEEFLRSVFTDSGRNIMVLGFTGIADCMRLAISSERHGGRLLFVADAIGTPQIRSLDPQLLDEVVTTVLEQFGGSVMTSEILTLEAGWENVDAANS